MMEGMPKADGKASDGSGGTIVVDDDEDDEDDDADDDAAGDAGGREVCSRPVD
jgi:hypothetical protein